MKRNVLVIGNSNYTHLATVRSCKVDAELIADDFNLLKFHNIKRHQDLSGEALKNAIIEFANGYACDSLNVIYFSGHGMNIEGQDYILGTDYKEKISAAIPLKFVVEQFLGLHAYVVLIIDACRNFSEPVFQSFTGFEMPRDVLIAYASQIGKESFGVNKHKPSPFTSALHNHILKSNLTLNTLFQQVRGELKNNKYIQLSCEISTLTEEIYLVHPPVDKTDEAIYNFVQDSKNGNASETLIKATKIFDRGILDILYSHHKYGSFLYYKRTPMPLMSEAECKALYFKRLNTYGYECKDGRWYSDGKEIRIGELIPLALSMAFKKPLVAHNVKFRISAKLEYETIILSINTSLPAGFIILYSFPPKSPYIRSIVLCNGLTTISIPKGDIELTQDNSIIIEITSPIIGVDNPAYSIVGEGCRNLTGDCIEFSVLHGNQIQINKRITLDK